MLIILGFFLDCELHSRPSFCTLACIKVSFVFEAN